MPSQGTNEFLNQTANQYEDKQVTESVFGEIYNSLGYPTKPSQLLSIPNQLKYAAAVAISRPFGGGPITQKGIQSVGALGLRGIISANSPKLYNRHHILGLSGIEKFGEAITQNIVGLGIKTFAKDSAVHAKYMKSGIRGLINKPGTWYDTALGVIGGDINLVGVKGVHPRIKMDAQGKVFVKNKKGVMKFVGDANIGPPDRKLAKYLGLMNKPNAIFGVSAKQMKWISGGFRAAEAALWFYTAAELAVGAGKLGLSILDYSTSTAANAIANLNRSEVHIYPQIVNNYSQSVREKARSEFVNANRYRGQSTLGMEASMMR